MDSELTQEAATDLRSAGAGGGADNASYCCPRCTLRYSRENIAPPDYKCRCGLQLAYPCYAPSGEVLSLFGWLSSPGDIINNRYRVVQLLGRGGFGSTYLVEDTKLGAKRWALKEIPERMYDEHETRILSKLHHPSIPGIADREVAGGMVYIALEFGGGRTFETARRASPDQRVPLTQLAPWVRQLCDVLSYMHAQQPPVVHRDLKPGNVLLDDHDRVMLIDFGIAKEAIESEHTHTLGRAVTHGFSPPEQAMGAGTDTRSDIYALAATVYFMLTAKRPPGARERIQGIEVEPPSAIAGGIPPAVDRALVKGLSLNPNERQQSVDEFGTAFDYNARTVATYDDMGGAGATVMIDSSTSPQTGTTTNSQRSINLGPDGQVEVIEPVESRSVNRGLIAGVVAFILMIAVAGTYFMMAGDRAAVTSVDGASTTNVERMSTPAAGDGSGDPSVDMVPETQPSVPGSVAESADLPVPGAPKESAMDVFLQRRKPIEPEATESEPASATQIVARREPAPSSKPVTEPEPSARGAVESRVSNPQVDVAKVEPSNVNSPPASPPGKPTKDEIKNAWRDANKNTKFYE
ncbi:MAG: serine/threonine protein kinase [Gammaproteobacteria bacterium]